MADVVNEVLADYRQGGDGVLELWRYDLTVEQVVEVIRAAQAVREVRVLALGRRDDERREVRGSLRPLGEAGAAALAEALKQKAVPGLQTLGVAANRIGKAGAAALAGAMASVPRLQTLDVARNGIGAAGAAALAGALAGVPGLQTLKVRNNGIGDAGAAALAGALAGVPGLQTLYVGGNGIGDAGAAALAGALAGVPGLQTLAVGANDIGDAGAKALAGGLAGVPGLQTLDVGNNSIGAVGAAALAGALAGVPGLQTLKVGDNGIGDAGVAALAGALAGVPGLQTLNMEDNEIGAAGAAALAGALAGVPGLQTLNVEANYIGDAGAAALAGALKVVPGLQGLYVGWNGIGDVGAAALAGALKYVPGLQTLSVGSNDVGDAGAAVLAGGLKDVPGLETLDVEDTSISDAGAAALAGGLVGVPRLQTLSVSGNDIGYAGAAALAGALKHVPGLQALDVARNGIGDAGAAALAGALKYVPGLQTLSVGSNDVGDAGAAVLAGGLKDVPGLQTLDVRGNGIDSLDWLGEVPAQFSGRIKIDSNNIPLPKEVLRDEDWRVWLRAWRGATAELPLMKVVLLGEGEAGKTSLAACLRGEEPPEWHDPTRAFDVHVVTLGPAEAAGAMPPQVRLFDFGGQKHLQGLHRFFLASRRNVFVVVVRADKTLAENRLWHWLGVVEDVHRREVAAERQRRGEGMGATERAADTARMRAGMATELAPPRVLVVVTRGDVERPKTGVDDVRAVADAFVNHGLAVEVVGPLVLAGRSKAGESAVRVAEVRAWVEKQFGTLPEVKVRVHPGFVKAVQRMADVGGLDPTAGLVAKMPLLLGFDDLEEECLGSDAADQEGAAAIGSAATREDRLLWRTMLRNLGLLLWVGDRTDLAMAQASVEDLHGTPELLRRVYGVLWTAERGGGGPNPAGAVLSTGELHQALRACVRSTEVAGLINLLVGCSLLLKVDDDQYLVPDLLQVEGDTPPTRGFVTRIVERRFVPDWYLPRLLALNHADLYPAVQSGRRHVTFGCGDEWVGVSVTPRDDGPDEVVVQRWAKAGGAPRSGSQGSSGGGA